jgi:hypothetical protein
VVAGAKIFLNMSAPTEVKSNNRNYSFSEKLKQIFDKFPKYTV